MSRPLSMVIISSVLVYQIRKLVYLLAVPILSLRLIFIFALLVFKTNFERSLSIFKAGLNVLIINEFKMVGKVKIYVLILNKQFFTFNS